MYATPQHSTKSYVVDSEIKLQLGDSDPNSYSEVVKKGARLTTTPSTALKDNNNAISASQFIEDVLGVYLPSDRKDGIALTAALRDGKLLKDLIYTIIGGKTSVPLVEDDSIPQNIKEFQAGCKEINIPEFNICSYDDLINNNVEAVARTILEIQKTTLFTQDRLNRSQYWMKRRSVLKNTQHNNTAKKSTPTPTSSSSASKMYSSLTSSPDITVQAQRKLNLITGLALTPSPITTQIYGSCSKRPPQIPYSSPTPGMIESAQNHQQQGEISHLVAINEVLFKRVAELKNDNEILASQVEEKGVSALKKLAMDGLNRYQEENLKLVQENKSLNDKLKEIHFLKEEDSKLIEENKSLSDQLKEAQHIIEELGNNKGALDLLMVNEQERKIFELEQTLRDRDATIAYHMQNGENSNNSIVNEEKVTSLQKTIETLKGDMEQLQNQNISLANETQLLKTQLDESLKRMHEEKSIHLENVTSKKEMFKNLKVSSQETSSSVREILNLAVKDLASMSAKMVNAVKANQKAKDEKLTTIETLYDAETKSRRAIYDQLQEARGNIRVFCRIRPLLEHEIKAAEGETKGCEIVATSRTPYCVGVSKSSDGKNRESLFEFDKVFGPKADQQSVFQEVCPLVYSALDGFHVCVFAYGQTGSGKTHTMEGTESDRGINFRILSELFEGRVKREKSHAYDISVHMVEIYNEVVRDLLNTNADGCSSTAGMEIREGPDGIYMQGVIEKKVNSIEEVYDAVKIGNSNRATGKTNANEHSSRSHSLLFININGLDKVVGNSFKGRIVLVDLAGSERVKKTAAEGDRLKEAQNINRSLSALGDVVAALTNKNRTHIPFRNSKLTYLLKDSLGEDNKALMLVQVAPSDNDVSETLCSLKFASRVKNVELGAAKSHSGTSGDVATINKLKDSLAKGKEEYKSLEKANTVLQNKLSSFLETENKNDIEVRDLKDKVRSKDREIATFKMYEEEAKLYKEKLRSREKELISLRGDSDATNELKEQLKAKEREIIKLKEAASAESSAFEEKSSKFESRTTRLKAALAEAKQYGEDLQRQHIALEKSIHKREKEAVASALANLEMEKSHSSKTSSLSIPQPIATSSKRNREIAVNNNVVDSDHHFSFDPVLSNNANNNITNTNNMHVFVAKENLPLQTLSNNNIDTITASNTVTVTKKVKQVRFMTQDEVFDNEDHNGVSEARASNIENSRSRVRSNATRVLSTPGTALRKSASRIPTGASRTAVKTLEANKKPEWNNRTVEVEKENNTQSRMWR